MPGLCSPQCSFTLLKYSQNMMELMVSVILHRVQEERFAVVKLVMCFTTQATVMCHLTARSYRQPQGRHSDIGEGTRGHL